MDGKHNIAQYRGRLDKTLASHDLTNEEMLKTLVKNQILNSSKSEIGEYIDNVVEKRTKEVANLIGMLRSASLIDDEGGKSSEAPHGGWKIKQDTHEYRVMYREGPEGTPFHTLLVEGYINGPIDVCLCISIESILYQKWWPQYSVPTFKILSSDCLQKVRMGEQISLVRMKVSWPMSAREAVVHYFVFEYFQDDLVIVLLTSISDLESIDKSTHGFTKDGIPDAQEVVRIDLVGGFALQKVTADRSYFRTIVNMDIKLDFVPPAFINFVSRQLIGSGFKLYQKEVASVAKGDEDFGKILKDPLYIRIREALYSDNISNGDLKTEAHKSDMQIVPEEHPMKIVPAEVMNIEKEGLSDDYATHSTPEITVLTDQKSLGEIQEIEEEEKKEEIEEIGHVREDSEDLNKSSTTQIIETFSVNNKKKVVISRDVQQALGTLEKVISIFRENKFDHKTVSNFQNLEKDAEKDSKSSEEGQICANGVVFVEPSKNEAMEWISHEPRNSSCSHGSRIAPASPEEHILNPTETHQAVLNSPINETTKAAVIEKNTNVTNENITTKRKNRKMRFCCLHFLSGQLMV